MKLSVLAAVILAGSSLCTLPACKSSKEVASEVATRDVRSFQQNLDQVPGQIDRTMATLSQLTSGNATNRQQLLTDFTNQLSTLKSHAYELGAQRDAAEKNVQRYFREWAKESRGISSTADRQNAYQAIDAGRARTDIAMDYMRNGARDFRSLTDKLSGFQKTLSTDMSPDAIRRVGDQFGVTNDDAIKVKGYIARLSEQIDATLTGR